MGRNKGIGWRSNMSLIRIGIQIWVLRALEVRVMDLIYSWEVWPAKILHHVRNPSRHSLPKQNPSRARVQHICAWRSIPVRVDTDRGAAGLRCWSAWEYGEHEEEMVEPVRSTTSSTSTPATSREFLQLLPLCSSSSGNDLWSNTCMVPDLHDIKFWLSYRNLRVSQQYPWLTSVLLHSGITDPLINHSHIDSISIGYTTSNCKIRRWV